MGTGGEMAKSFGVAQAIALQQKNLAAMTKSWMVVAEGLTAIAARRRAMERTHVLRCYQWGDNLEEVVARQAEFSRKAMEAPTTNIRDLTELTRIPGTEISRHGAGSCGRCGRRVARRRVEKPVAVILDSDLFGTLTFSICGLRNRFM